MDIYYEYLYCVRLFAVINVLSGSLDVLDFLDKTVGILVIKY